jgi:hypothetical protein
VREASFRARPLWHITHNFKRRIVNGSKQDRAETWCEDRWSWQQSIEQVKLELGFTAQHRPGLVVILREPVWLLMATILIGK